MALWPLLALVLALPALAQPYKRTPMGDSGLCVYWQNRQFTYQLSSAGYSQLSNGSVEAALNAAVGTWQTLSGGCSDFTYTEGPQVQNAVEAYDGFNEIMFRETDCADPGVVPAGDPCLGATGVHACNNVYNCWGYDNAIIALTTVTYDLDSGVIYDTDIEINAGPTGYGNGQNRLFTTVASPPCNPTVQSASCVATDLQNTLTHEFGHVIGLAHVDGGNSTMYATANIGETSKRVIDFGSAEGFCGIYPAGGASSPSCTLAQPLAISAGSEGTPQLACSAGGRVALSFWALLGLVVLLRRDK
jgi:hypothetical protein